MYVVADVSKVGMCVIAAVLFLIGVYIDLQLVFCSLQWPIAPVILRAMEDTALETGPVPEFLPWPTNRASGGLQ